MIPLFEQYRPTAFTDVLGQNRAVAQLEAVRRRGLGGRMFWISGRSGTGKTTLARIIASMVADAPWVLESDAATLTADKLLDLERSLHLYGGGSKGGRAWIFNEAHGLSKLAVRRFLVLSEPMPEHTCIVFTTTNDGEEQLIEDHVDGPPFLSRCVVLALTSQGLAKPFAERAKAIAESEGLDGQPIGAYVKLVQSCKNNMRAVLQRIESGEMMECNK